MKHAQNLTWNTRPRLRIPHEEDAIGIRRASLLTAFLGLICVSAGLVGCGKQAFVVSSTLAAQQAPGSFTIPPKVDILMLEDDTGSMAEAYSSISSQTPKFLEQLESRGWDYHFAVAPLSADRPISQVLASKHDGNWGSEWTPAYPGQQPSDALPASVFRKVGDFGSFLGFGDIHYETNAIEPGLANLKNILSSRINGTGLVRPDSMLVILAMSTGNDTSGINYCQGSDGIKRPCNQTSSTNVLFCGSGSFSGPCYNNPTDSLNFYKAELRKIKSNANLLKFYAATTNGETTCPNLPQAKTRSGTRYYAMTQEFGGESFNLCQQSITNIFDSLASKLQSLKVAIHTKYLFTESEPAPESIVVTVYRGGSVANAEIIPPSDPANPQSDSKSWTYVGYQTDIETSEYAVNPPVAFNKRSGFAIRLNGTAVLSGDDSAHVEFKTLGLHDSAK